MKKSFTLAETIIVLLILGVIATLTIPNIVRNHRKNISKTKIQKAMNIYAVALNSMIYENNILTNNNLHHWADNEENNCSNTSLYFKIADGTGCRFKTADGIWWDISNIENPIIILDEKYKDTDRSELETLAKTEKVDGKKVYVYALVGRRDETTGSIRVNDKSYETTSPNKDYMEKLYGEINSTSNVSVS